MRTAGKSRPSVPVILAGVCVAVLAAGCSPAGDGTVATTPLASGSADGPGVRKPESSPADPEGTSRDGTRGEAPPGSTARPRAAGAVKGYRAPRQVAPVAEPAAVRIPRFGVDSPLDRLGRNPDGTVEVPDDYARAGWYAEGARPGQRGAAVLLGHVDSRAGPAVFHRVADLELGDEVLVDRTDGSTATFVVERIERHDKEAFPTDAVYFPTLEPSLALVTCGGEFDTDARSYRDNVIAFAAMRE